MSVSNSSATQTNKGIKFDQSKISYNDFKTIDTKYLKYNKRYFCCTENFFFVLSQYVYYLCTLNRYISN
jgi:hypothetical protein